ncbi:hypothetical protein JAO76_04705 [Pontibacter sp. BT310]|uniref:S9 family peptidase n=1 Tax=Pontibacter populi TaxID=890055 RepID=A0ABS6X8L6_9BACT|nr:MULTISPECIES: hypothetical protein [Pontibacter]MBJ6117477.1 hypothetical protein [Pontibacter sp. BT310]MBR0569902.1 hypothetical protein [Microvirga sp. STS03]MBW3364330.1 hypothetical protein [Pontibacter populi]
MHKFILTLLLFMGFAQMASAQREFANLELPLRQPEDLVSVADDNGNVCLYFYQNNKLHFTLVSPTGEVLAQHEIPYRWNRDPQVLGTRVTDTDFIFYSRYENGRRDYVRPFAINRKTGAFRSLQDVELDKERNTYFVGGFGDDEHFYMLYTDRKDRLHLYRSSDSPEGLAKMERQIFEPNLPDTRTKDTRLMDLVYVHPDMEQTVVAGYHSGKIYSRDGNIYIIFDGQSLKDLNRKEATTEILALNWDTGKTTYRTLPALEQRNDPSFNSFLFRDTLFRLQLDRDKLNLTAYNFNTLEPVKTYTFSGDQDIAIKSTPVYQRGMRGLFASDVDTVKQTSKVMKKLAEGLPAITVNAFTDSTIQLTIGSYDPPGERNTSSDMSRMVRTPDQYYRTSRGLMMIPGRWVPAYNIPNYYLNSPYYSRYFYDPYGQGGSRPSGPGISTYFRAVLDDNTLAKTDNGTKELVQDKVDKFEQELKSEPDYKTVYRYGNKLHYGYYDRKSKTFRIMEFAPGN